ncbi:Lrp/AsnC family transcriptional regulator [Labrys neptuniae]
MGASAKPKLDAIDLKILREVQADAALALADLADRVGISPTPCWRRLQRLEQQGVIRKKVALLDRRQLNVGITVFIAIRTSQHNADWLEAFSQAVRDIPEIVDVYRMSGEIDYLLRAYVPDIESYDSVYKKLISKVALTDVTSMFAMEELKSTTEVPLIFADRK